MPRESGRLWTVGRQLLGNLLPLALGLPLLVMGVAKSQAKGLQGESLYLLLGFLAVTWLATNFLGLTGSVGLKSEMGRRLHQERPFDKTERAFVGFSRPRYSGWLDPHEDIGFLIVHPESLEFFGSERRVEISRANVTKVTLRANIHSWVGLGGWIAVEGNADGKAVRFLVEPRERATHIGNALLRKKLRRRLENWLNSSPAVSG